MFAINCRDKIEEYLSEADENELLQLAEEFAMFKSIPKSAYGILKKATVICWEVDLEINETKRTPEGNTLKLTKDKNRWILKYGPSKIIPVFEIKSIINDINNVAIASN